MAVVKAAYHHGDLRTALIEAALEIIDEIGPQALHDALPISQFAASGEAYLNFAMGYPAYYRVMFSGDLLASKGNEALRHTSAASFVRMIDDLRMAQDMGIVRQGDPTLQAISIVSTVHGFVSLANDNRLTHLYGDRYTAEQVKDFVITAIFEGLGVS